MDRQISYTLIVSCGQYSDGVPPNLKPKNWARVIV